jgi:predicted nucleic acid-binding protein
MKSKIYIETTIPSFYFEERKSIEALSRKRWTKQWWKKDSMNYEIYSSLAVVEELNETPYPKRQKCIEFVNNFQFLEITREIINIVEAYISNKIMPDDSGGDALHLALSSYYKCDFLLTWNCKHLANANKFDHIRWINSSLGLYNPKIVTPLELIGEDYEI